MQESEIDQRMHRQKEEMLDILDEYFNRGVDKKKFIDVARIPLICQDISTIHRDLSNIKEYIEWAVKLVIGAIILGAIAMLFKS